MSSSTEDTTSAAATLPVTEDGGAAATTAPSTPAPATDLTDADDPPTEDPPTATPDGITTITSADMTAAIEALPAGALESYLESTLSNFQDTLRADYATELARIQEASDRQIAMLTLTRTGSLSADIPLRASRTTVAPVPAAGPTHATRPPMPPTAHATRPAVPSGLPPGRLSRLAPGAPLPVPAASG